MSSEKKSDTKNATTTQSTPRKGTSLTEIQANVSREQEQGFRGTEVDPTPNENYTVAGVTSDAPTPETDADSAKEARAVTGLGLSPLEATERDKAIEEAGKKFADQKRSNR